MLLLLFGNCLQATHSGFSLINQENVFKVCDQPHPILVANLISHCLSAEIDNAYNIMKHLCDLGYSATDIITTLFRVVRNYKMQEFLKLEFIKVCIIENSADAPIMLSSSAAGFCCAPADLLFQTASDILCWILWVPAWSV